LFTAIANLTGVEYFSRSNFKENGKKGSYGYHPLIVVTIVDGFLLS
jgi:hypothetical protein